MNFKRLIISLALPQLAGFIGSIFTVAAIPTWYITLQKPSLNPPNWLFGPVWIMLYALMGVSVYLIWQKIEEQQRVKSVVRLFWIHLFFNAIWSIIFFGFQNPGLAFVNIVIIWLLIIVLIVKFGKINKWAACLLIPYLLWVSFASYLNYSIWKLNQNKTEPLACTLEAKLCPDGSYVSRIPPECDFALCPKEDLIQIENLRANDTIISPLLIKGKARGFWFFEADFPIRLYDANGQLVATTIARTQSNWMTEDFVPFSAELKFEKPKTKSGTLVLEKDNPSGFAENADELRIPILFAEKTQKINLYYYNPELDKDESGNLMCSRAGLVAVEREIALSKTPIQDTLQLLLSGQLGEQEKNQGISTEYPLEGFSLKGASLEDGTLTLEFTDLNNKTIGGSCRVGVLWFQIEETAKQFPEVEQVRFLPEDIFQP
jgi:translocator protein